MSTHINFFGLEEVEAREFVSRARRPILVELLRENEVENQHDYGIEELYQWIADLEAGTMKLWREYSIKDLRQELMEVWTQNHELGEEY